MKNRALVIIIINKLSYLQKTEWHIKPTDLYVFHPNYEEYRDASCVRDVG